MQPHTGRIADEELNPFGLQRVLNGWSEN